jgi:hypothetical protein
MGKRKFLKTEAIRLHHERAAAKAAEEIDVIPKKVEKKPVKTKSKKKSIFKK